MAARAAEDAALQQTSMPTALLGVDMVAVSLANATAEVENLLRKECDVILECRFCRNLFRSIINFISHKRTHCRGLYQTVAAAASAISDVGRRSNGEKAALIELLPRRASSSGDPSDSTSVGVGSPAPFESLNEKNASTDESSSSCHASIFTGTHLSRKTAKARTGPSAALRRVSAVAVLSKRIETTTVELADGAAKLDLHTLPRIAKSVPTTKITNGVQEVVDMPNDLASKEPVESDRVVMVIPQDLTSSYGNMRLRNRRQAPGGDVPARSVSPAEMELVERVTKYAGGQVEVATLSCLATSCEKDKRTFSSLKCLAYHVSVWHKPLTPVNNRFICLVCGSLFARNVGLQTHLRMFHRDIYDEHHRSRSLEREDSDTRGRKTQKKKARGSDDSSANGGAADQPRSRSLSPLSNDDGVDARHQHEMKDSPLTRTRSLLIDRQSLSHLESPTRLSLSANRRSLNQRSTHRLENVLANLRRSREDAENETDQRPASSASSSNKRVDTRRSHKKGANKLQAAVTNSANISLSQTPTPKRGAGRPRKVIPAPSDEATASSVSNASDSVIANGSKTTPTDDMKPPAPSKSVNGPVATMRGTSGSSKMDSSDSKQSPTKTSNSRAQENNNKDSSSSSVVKKERSVSRESHKEREDGVKSATGTDAGDGSRVERSRRPKRQREQRPTLESEQPTSSSSSDDDDDEDDEKHTNTSGADSGTNGKSPGQDEGSSEIAPVVAALPSRRRSRTRAAAAEQQKSTDADHTNESDDSVEKSTPPTKATTSKRKAPPMPESSDSSGEEEEEEMASSVRTARSKRPPAYLADGSFITGFSSSAKSGANREEREETDFGKAKEPTKSTVKGPFTPTKKAESQGTSKRKSPKSNSACPKTKHARIEAPSTSKSGGAGRPSSSASKAKSTSALAASESSSVVSSPPTSPSESRRKQNLAALPPTRSDDVQIIKMPNQNPERPRDLSDLPVYLTEGQRDLFTRSLQVLGAAKEDRHKCVHCDNVLPNIQEGRRHVVMHLNVIRLKCSLCSVGSFFCSDMRSHLMNRHCTNIDLAPTNIVRPGKDVPCMSQEQADSLTQLVDISRPGRVLYTSGKVMSNEHPAGIQPPSSLDANLLPMVHVSNMYGDR